MQYGGVNVPLTTSQRTRSIRPSHLNIRNCVIGCRSGKPINNPIPIICPEVITRRRTRREHTRRRTRRHSARNRRRPRRRPEHDISSLGGASDALGYRG